MKKANFIILTILVVIALAFDAGYFPDKDVGLIYGETTTFFYHLLAMVIVIAFAFFGSLLLYKVVDIVIPMRVTEEKELEGLDTSQHDESFV